MHGKKVQDVYTKIYDTCETIFSDQTGRFPTQSQLGNKYIMVIASRTDEQQERQGNDTSLQCTSTMFKTRRHCTKKQMLDNQVSEAMKNRTRNDLKFTMELVPPGCHRRNAAEVAIRNSSLTFSVY